jgi:hypothetical protein
MMVLALLSFIPVEPDLHHVDLTLDTKTKLWKTSCPNDTEIS